MFPFLTLLASLAASFASGPQPAFQDAGQNAACEELVKILDNYGRRRDLGRGWRFEQGEFDRTKKKQALAKADLAVLLELQKLFPADSPILRSTARTAVESVTAKVKSGLDPAERTVPALLAPAVVAGGSADINMKAVLAATVTKQRQAIDELTDDENRAARMINEATDKLATLKCADPRALPAGPAEPVTPRTETGTSMRSDLGTNVAPWEGSYTHDFGTMTLEANLDRAGTYALIRTANGYGPAMHCTENGAVFWGTFTWKGGVFDARPWEGRIVGCVNGATLEGKFSNVETMTRASAALGVRSGSFIIRFGKDASKFAGLYHSWNAQSGQSGEAAEWTGVKK